MPSRRFHSKSRHGCTTCKQSKVRCDLTKPKCNRCVRLERPCSFVSESMAFVVVDSDTRASSSRSEGDRDSSPGTTMHRTMRDMELMHHYSTSTCLTMTDIPEKLPIWQYDIARLAFKHEFLLHGLLALSALHTSSGASSRDRALDDLARNHQSLALASYIPLLRHIDEQNCHAMFAFSAILGATSFAFLQQQETERTGSTLIAGIVDVFELLVGSNVIAIEGRPWLKDGSLANLLGPPPLLIHEETSCDPEARTSLDAILACAEAAKSPGSCISDVSEDCMSMYASSARLLAVLFSSTPTETVSMEDVVRWPALAGTPLITRLKRGDPIALVILAHYGVALHISDHIWYLKGLGVRLIRSISEVVNEEWVPYLTWPLSHVSTSF